MVQVATLADMAGWLALAREVEPLFGPMADEPAFHDALRSAIEGERAYCVRVNDEAPGARLCGAILVSTKDNKIGWLAVAAAHRGQGHGRALLAHAIAQLDPAWPIFVQTFADTVKEGRPARRLYRAFGFCERCEADPTPSGVATVLMVRPAEDEGSQ